MLIEHGHHYSDIWDSYSVDEVHFYYVECKIQEIFKLREAAIAARVSETDKKGWTKFTKSLDQNIAQLRLEVEDEVIEGSSSASVVRGNKNIDSFFGSLMGLPKINVSKLKKPQDPVSS